MPAFEKEIKHTIEDTHRLPDGQRAEQIDGVRHNMTSPNTERQRSANHFYTDAAAFLRQGKAVVIVTIIASEGSVPRGPGAHMLVGETGILTGTIGGGIVEYKAACLAHDLLQKKKSAVCMYDLGIEKKPREKDSRKEEIPAKNLGMVCGGQIRIACQFISTQDDRSIRLLEQAGEYDKTGQKAWLILDLSEEDAIQMTLALPDDKSVIHLIEFDDETAIHAMGSDDEPDVPAKNGDQAHVQLDREVLDGLTDLLRASPCLGTVSGCAYYTEPLAASVNVYIFGGGHVARQLVPVLSRVGFRCIVLDDREEFSCRDYFPEAADIRLCDFTQIGKSANLTKDDYAVVMTRGHQHDYEVQAQLLRVHPAYIGIMGSRKKIAYVTERLLQDGFSQEEIDACHMPIGLAIGAETPEEIAISIAAELIEKKRTGVNSGRC